MRKESEIGRRTTHSFAAEVVNSVITDGHGYWFTSRHAHPADAGAAEHGNYGHDDPALTSAQPSCADKAPLTSREVGSRQPAADRMPSPGGRWATQRNRIGELTKREYEVFLLLGEGLDNHKISRLLGVGERTVKLHVTRILRKLGLESRLQAGLAAAEHALLAYFPKVE
jgi:DNA-binding CsgD family transcriptional regulator